MIREAIVLAGGLGTRLQSVVPDLPKCLAPVAGKPFLEYLLDHGRRQGIGRFIFALGYKTGLVEAFVKERSAPSEYHFSVEKEPLGTGGAIYQACRFAKGSAVIVLNADTFFALSLQELSDFHREKRAACSLALKPMTRFDRYGAVDLNARQQVTGFHEKRFMEKGLINGGAYALDVAGFLAKPFPPAFSFEKDYLEKEYQGGKIFGMISDAYFIDIGIPDDYRRAQTELPQHTNDGL
jgi:D-glycero-alpha-D-manno-heptose 1-phosphate guanylyltransferase